MRIFLSLMFVLLGQSAAAHAGHWAELAGHDHLVAGVAIGAAIAVGIWGALKGGKEASEHGEDGEIELEEEAA